MIHLDLCHKDNDVQIPPSMIQVQIHEYNIIQSISKFSVPVVPALGRALSEDLNAPFVFYSLCRLTFLVYLRLRRIPSVCPVQLTVTVLMSFIV